jgi:diguanylate cyclase (GGDEF)-like protein
MADAVPPAAAAQLLAATADAVLLVDDGRVVRAWPAAVLAGHALAQLVHPNDDLPLPPPPGTVARLRLHGREHRWFEVSGVRDPGGGCWLAARDVHERVEGERDLERKFRRTLQAVDATIDGLAVYRARRDSEGSVTGLVLTFINAAGARGFAGDRSTLVGKDLADFLPHSRDNGLWEALLAALETGQPVPVRLQGAGESRGVTESIAVRLDADTVVSSWRDVTEMVEQQELLARAYEETANARAALQAALDATTDSFAVYGLERDESGGVVRIVVRLANAAAAEPLGFSPDDLVGHDLLEVFSDLRSCGLWEAIVDSADSGEGRRHRAHIQDQNGAWQASFDNTIAPVGEDEVVVTWRDVTRDEQGRRHLEQTRNQAEHAATHDHLTGLPNRALLENRLREALDAPGDGLVGVVFCDLDEFKAVNDTYGHLAGDLVLTAVAQRLHLLTRHGETAARLSGDEFVLLLRDLPPGWRPEEFLRRADRAVRRPVDVGPAVVTPSASLGVVLVDPGGHSRSPKELLEEADRAMYQVKRQRSAMQAGGGSHHP